MILGNLMGSRRVVMVALIMAVLGFNLIMPNANARTVAIRPGFYDGNAYLRLGQAQKVAYISGVLDGIYMAPILDAKNTRIEGLHRCIDGMTNIQICAIVNKFLQENPARWHEPMNNLVYLAIIKACGIEW